MDRLRCPCCGCKLRTKPVNQVKGEAKRRKKNTGS
jgi:hypothetical protein